MTSADGPRRQPQHPGAATASADALPRPHEAPFAPMAAALLYRLVEAPGEPGCSEPATGADRVDGALIDACIAQIDAALCAQLNAILHHPTLQRLESAWRSLYSLVGHIDGRQNIKVDWLHATDDQLARDFEDSPELPKSGLYRLLYSSEYGVFGGEPYGVVVGNYAFGPTSRDLSLLEQIAAVCAMAHAPFVTNACPSFFGDTSFEALTNLNDVPAALDGPQMAKWQRFRDLDHSRYVGLCLPRFLLRLPYTQTDVSVASFNFCEDVDAAPQNFLWGFASVALATRIADSFARYRWCPHIVGPYNGGAIAEMLAPLWAAAPTWPKQMPTEVQIGDSLEYTLSQEGFMALSYRKGQGQACFLSANSTQRPGCDRHDALSNNGATQMSLRLGVQLPYLFILTRLAHYIKVMQRELIGQYQGRAQLQAHINQWLSQYVADMQNPAPNVRARRPLRRAAVTIEDVAGQSEWYRCTIQVQPHLRCLGAAFTLCLIGRLDKI